MKKSFRPIWNRIPSILKNKYAFAFSAFAIWMVFFDKYSVINQMRISSTLDDMNNTKKEYIEGIEEAKSEIESVEKNTEEFARENFYMKKDNEKVYIIEVKE